MAVALVACDSSDSNPAGGATNAIEVDTDVGGFSAVDPNANSSGPFSDDISASYRHGQTFLVWRESGSADEYHVYRHTSPISDANLSAAARLTGTWGPLGNDTSVNRYGGNSVPGNFVISDSGQTVSDDRGLFVHTVQNNQQGAVYYAVTSVVGGVEDRTIVPGRNATTNPVNEFVSTPRPVLTVSTNGGKGRIYTLYMDYARWNPTLKGYAYNFSVALPANYSSSTDYPLMVKLHSYNEPFQFESQSEYEWPVIQLFPSDPGEEVGSTHTWWYGFAKDHNYLTQGSIPNSGSVENFSEQQVLASVEFLINDGQFSVDKNLVHVWGHSMGGSGALALGMRYPGVFAGIYASEPMTNYAGSPVFQENFTRLWGQRSSNLRIVNNGRYNGSISNYNSTGVWSWMNHQEQLKRRRGDRFSYLMVDHGKADQVIEWQSQGQPMAQVFTDARVGFSASAVGGAGHSWLGFDSVVTSVFGLGYGDETAWRFPGNSSFPGIHNASGSGSLQPGATGDDRHNKTLEWSTAKNNFHQGIVDSSNRYEISLRSTTTNQTADITPRNTNSFRPSAGVVCNWSATSIGGNSSVGSGNSTVDGDRLLTIRGVSILASGTRLLISCP